MTCFGSIRLTTGRPRESSVYSAEGTAAHWVRGTCLELGLDVRHFVGQTIAADGYTFEVKPEWVDYLQPGIDRLREMRGTMIVEHRVTLDTWMPGQFGTLDAGVVDGDLVVVNDLKFGAGELVDAERNKQLMIYALGFWDNIARRGSTGKRIRLEIDQPRAGGISTWETTLDDLLAFGEEVKVAAARTYEPDAPLQASPKGCRWCPIKADCGEHARYLLEVFSAKFDDLDTAALIGEPPGFPNHVTPARRSYILEHEKMFTGWMTALYESALSDALAGREVPGLKAVPGRAGARAWSDEDEAAKVLGAVLPDDKVFESKVISPTTAEKRLSTKQWDKVKGLITRSDPKPILVPLSDKREAIKPITEMFDDLD